MGKLQELAGEAVFTWREEEFVFSVAGSTRGGVQIRSLGWCDFENAAENLPKSDFSLLTRAPCVNYQPKVYD